MLPFYKICCCFKSSKNSLSYSRHYEDDFEPEDDEINEDDISMATGEPRPADPVKRGGHKGNKIEDDIYDFSKSTTSYWQ